MGGGGTSATARSELPAMGTESAHDKNLVELVKQIVIGRIASDRLVIPAMPATTLKCLTMLRSPELSLRQVAATLARDPILAAQVVRLANSAAYGGMGSAGSIEQATTRLGAQRLKTLLIEASARQVFDSRDPRIAVAFRGIWEHSVAVGLMARDTAMVCRAPDPEGCYLSGLLHDVGKPVVAAMLLEAEKMISAPSRGGWIEHEAWLEAVQSSHRSVGAAIAEKWRLPESVARCIRDCTDYDSTDRHSIANVVRFANALAKKEGVYVGAVDADDVDALLAIGRSLLGIDEAACSQLMHNLKERVRSQTV